MLAFAENDFRLGKRGKDGVTLRETIEVYERMSGKIAPDRGEEVEFPEILYDLWQWFLDLHYARGTTMAGSASITYLDVQAYSHLRKINLSDWQLTAIRYLDNTFLASQNEKQQSKT